MISVSIERPLDKEAKFCAAISKINKNWLTTLFFRKKSKEKVNYGFRNVNCDRVNENENQLEIC
jgi:hypothetical protein